MALSLRPSKRLLIVIGLLGFIAVAVPALLALMVDAGKYQNMAVEQAKLLIGREVVVREKAQIALFPSPSLSIHNAEIGMEDTVDADNPPPRLRIEKTVIGLSWGSLFADTPQVTSVVLQRPSLTVARGQSGEVQWEWLRDVAGAAGGALSIPFTIEGGAFTFRNNQTQREEKVENLSFTIAHSASGIAASGSAIYREQPFRLYGSVTPPAEGDGAGGSALEIKLSQSDATYLSITAQRVARGESFALENGKMELSIENPDALLAVKPAQAPQEGEEAAGPYVVKITSDLAYSDGVLTLGNATIETPDSAGTGSITFTPGAEGEAPTVLFALDFSRLKLSRDTLSMFLAPGPSAQQLIAQPAGQVTIDGGGLPPLALEFKITAAEVFLDAQHITEAAFDGTVREDTLAITALNGKLAGDTQFNLTGNLVDTPRGKRFQGAVETLGPNLRALLVSLDPAAEQLPEKGFGEYSLKSNLFVSSEQLRLSEAEVKLGELTLLGGLVTYFEQQPRVEADITMQDINLDYFRDSWREGQMAGDAGEFIFRINSSVNFSWLRELKPVIDLKLNFDRFRFLEHDGTFASFRLYGRSGEMGLHNIEMQYPEGTLKGTVKLSVASELPYVDAQLEMPQFDSAYFSKDGDSFGQPWVNAKAIEKRWSEELFDFSWMYGVTGKFNLNISRLTHHGELYEKFMMESTLQGEQLSLAKFSFEKFGGKIDLTGTLTGGKVPGLSASFTLYNADMAQLLAGFSTVDKLGGRVSLSGSVVTSGIHFLSWVQQADAKVVLAARGVKVKGFNLQGIIDAVNASRSVADVVTNVNRALPSGTTDFAVDGNLNIAGGVIRTPGMTLSAGKATGALTGELQLVPWKIALNVIYQMPIVQGETIPTLTIDLIGPVQDYALKMDTTSLEAYVAKRIISR